MNPNYNPATVAAAENAVAEQTQRTVEQIEANQIERKTAQQRVAELENTFRSIEKPGVSNVPKLILTGTLKVRSVDGLDAEGDEDRKMVVLASEDGSTLLEILTNDERFLQDGAAVTIEVRELATSLDTSKAGRGPAAPDVPGLANPPFSTSTKPAPDITGTTGSKGTTEVSARATEPTGEAPNPDDPNLTGPSSDAGQATKGEIVQGQQTGGSSGKGTGKGESERGAAREAGKSDAAIETKDGLDPKAKK